MDKIRHIVMFTEGGAQKFTNTQIIVIECSK